MVTGRKRRILILASIAAVALAVWAAPMVGTIAFLLDIAGRGGLARDLLPVRHDDVSNETLNIPTRYGPITARLSLPSSSSTRTVIVFPGVHAGGIDEPRLALFSHRLAATGLNIVSVPLPDLRVFEITGKSTDIIEDATVWISSQPRLAPNGRVGLVGVSFAGGLALVAAGRPSLAHRIDVVLSLGGHGDLPRALHYLCTGLLPDGTIRTPHDYGLAILAVGAVRALVPEADAPALEDAIRTYLEASMDDSADQTQATALLARAHQQAAALRDPARSIMTWILDRDVVNLGRVLDPVVDDVARDPALSPERSPATDAPVFLLQGSEDNVIPSTETPLLAEYLARHGNAHVRTLLTPAVSHVGLDPAVGPLDWWRLVRFWQALRSALG